MCDFIYFCIIVTLCTKFFFYIILLWSLILQLVKLSSQNKFQNCPSEYLIGNQIVDIKLILQINTLYSIACINQFAKERRPLIAHILTYWCSLPKHSLALHSFLFAWLHHISSSFSRLVSTTYFEIEGIARYAWHLFQCTSNI